MGIFLVYAAKSAICLVLFYLFYRLLLSKDTFHSFNRVALLCVSLASLFLPLLQVSGMPDAAPLTPMPLKQQQGTMDVVPVDLINETDNFTSWMVLGLSLVYGLGMLTFVGCQLLSLWQLKRMMRRGHREDIERYLPDVSTRAVLLVHDKAIAPFSWMHYVVVSRADLAENGREILLHELTHIRLHHSLDLLLSNFCIAVQWFNPASWLLRQELQNIHEYEADEAVIQAGVNAKQYQLLLIKKAVGTRLYSMTNSFNHSSLKKRITMMLKEKSNPWARLKYLYVLPVAAVAVTAFARPEISSVAEQISSAKFSDLKSIDEMKSPQIEPMAKVEAQQADQVLDDKDRLPQFADGGSTGLVKYLADNIRYPETAVKAGKEGRVLVQFVVEKDGSISNVQVMRSLHPDLDAEAVRVIQGMPKWIPAMENGEPVAVKFMAPVQFQLPKSASVVASTVSNQHKENPLYVLVDGKKVSNDRHVKGLVVDEDGNPIIGATVLLVGTKNGTVTDTEGKFTMLAPEGAMVEISYIGVETEKLKV